MRYAALAVALLLAGCGGDDGPSAPQAPQNFTLEVEGTVFSTSPGDLTIQGATVEITTDRGARHSDVTNKNGHFSMAVPLSRSRDCTVSGVGDWAPCSVVVRAPGYQTLSESSWNLPCNATVPGPWRVTFRLDPQS